MTLSVSAAGRAALPVELTHFVGRERELVALRALAGSARLLTLTGAGGSGKSRLALQLIPHIAREPGETLGWVELAPLPDAALLPAAVLRALDVPTEGGAATTDAVIAAIRGRTVTLVLDNCEHIVDACATLADALLRACPQLRIIATSREALGIAGERAWLVPPLALADSDAQLDALAGSDAVRLFVDRARDVLPDFALTAQNARVVADICARLDGIPLAIELAAARVRHMTPEQIRERLGNAFALLTTGSRAALPRHRTLRATLDWSHDLLPEPARVVLRRLAVFRGGFTLDMVERVASGGDVRASDVLDLIAMLADRSLIVVREHDGVARYQLLETMRQYAVQRLAEAGETHLVHGRLAAAVSALVAEVEPAFTTTERRAAFHTLEPELDNIREVLAWTRTHDGAQHVRLVGMLWWFWFTTRHWVEAHQWITEALALPDAAAPSRDRAALLFAAGALNCLRAQMAEARPLLHEAVALAAALHDEKLEAYSLNYLAMTFAASLSPDAAEYAGRAERWLRAHGDAYGLRLALLLGGMAKQGAGDTVAATAMMEEAIAIARSFGQDRELAVALQTYATILIAAGRQDEAGALVIESLRALERDPSFLFIARAIDYHAICSAAADPARAARTIGVGEAVRRHVGANRFAHDQVRVDALVEQLRDRLGDAAFEHAFASGLEVQPLDAAADVLGAAAGAPVLPAAPAPEPVPTRVSRPAADEPTADLVVRALGPIQVTVRGHRIEQWPYGKPKELLALLMLHPHGRTRQEIGDALWPGAAPAQVRNSFHVTMHHLRRTLGHAEWIRLDGERYRITSDISLWFDAAEFERSARAALERARTGAEEHAAIVTELRAALGLYRDHLLAGENAGSWRDDAQDRLRRLYCAAGVMLGTLLDEAGDAAGAANAYEAVVASEPLHEEAHRGLLLALTRAGKRAHALRHYERFRKLLLDLELEPEDETEGVYERIRRADIVPRP
jgi:predicted ATPase/DNA-binding SARP family transcriptional activator